MVSIPERVWGWLEPDTQLAAQLIKSKFQSLRGFGVGWSETCKIRSCSPSRFQSLRGFGVGWSVHSGWRSPNQAIVSIPERVWGWLEQAQNKSKTAEQRVSIPERVWGWLERDRIIALQPEVAFQSLRGFGVGWSAAIASALACNSWFQSLRGFGVGWSTRRAATGLPV